MGTGRNGGDAGRHPGRSRKPASVPHTPHLWQRCFSLVPCSHRAIGPQMFAGRSTQSQPPHGWTLLPSRSQALFGVLPPSLLPSPPLATLPARLGMLLPGAAQAELSPGEKELLFAVEGNISTKRHVCLRGHGALCPQGPGGSLGSPPGKELCSPGHGHIPIAAPVGTVPAPLLPEDPWQRGKGSRINAL